MASPSGRGALPLVLLLAAAASPAVATNMTAYLDGYISAEVMSKRSYGFGKFEVQMIGSGCVGVASGIGLYARNGIQEHDIGLMYYQDRGIFTAYVTRRESGVLKDVHYRQGWANASVTGMAGDDPTKYGAVLGIDYSSEGVNFTVDGYELTENLPVVGRRSPPPYYRAPSAGRSSLLERQVYALKHQMYAFAHVATANTSAALPITPHPPSVTCLPANIRFGSLKYEATSPTETDIDQPQWNTGNLGFRWNRVGAADPRTAPLASDLAVPSPTAAVPINGFLLMTIGYAQFNPLLASFDEDPDLVDSTLASAWAVQHHVYSSVTGSYDPQGLGVGTLDLDVVSIAGGGDRSVLVTKTVTPGEGTLVCSILRLRSGLRRDLTMAVVSRGDTPATLAQSDLLTVDENQWQLFNTCYVLGTAAAVDVELRLGTYDDIVRIHPYTIEIDFMYTMSISRQSRAVAFVGSDLLSTWWNNRAATTDIPQYPWVGPRRSGTRLDAWNSRLVNNTAADEGVVELTYARRGDANFTHYSLDFLRVGFSYRITIEATSYQKYKQAVFVSVNLPSGNILGGVNQFFVCCNETTAYTYTLRSPVTTNVVGGTLSIWLLQEHFDIGDVVIIKDVKMEQHTGSNESPPSLAITPSLDDRDAGLAPVASSAAPLAFNVVGQTAIPTHQLATRAPVPPVPLEDAYARRYDVSDLMRLDLRKTKYTPQTLPIAALREALGEELAISEGRRSLDANNIKVMAVCLGQGNLEVINSSTLVVDKPRERGGRMSPLCRGIDDSPAEWYAHLNQTRTLEVHFYIADLPPTFDQAAITRRFVTNLDRSIYTNSRIGTSFELDPTSIAFTYKTGFTVVTAAPPPVPGPVVVRSSLRTNAWVGIVVGTTLFCLCFGMCIAHQAIKLRRDLEIRGVEDSLDGSTEGDEELMSWDDDGQSVVTTTDAAGFEHVEKDPERRRSLV